METPVCHVPGFSLSASLTRRFSVFHVISVAALALFFLPNAQAQFNWSQRPSKGGPSARCCMGSAYSPVSGGIVLFGGSDNGSVDYNDTWLWTNKWSKISTANAPPPRDSAGLAFDSVHNVLVLFGGNDVNTQANLNDTWTFDGTNWTQQFPLNSPPGRGFDVTGMVFDTAAGNVVFFGGAGYPSVFFGDTWTWDGSNWTEQFPVNAPSARRAPITYDPTTGTVILFGGDDAAGDVFGDTWSWNGVNWTQLAPPTSPAARTQAEMAFNPLLNRIVLFSGSYGYDNVWDDTWTFTGTNWEEVLPATEPLNRYAAPFAYDPISRQMMTFGGYGVTGTNPRSDTWVFAK